MNYIDLFDEDDIAELRATVDIPPRLDEDSLPIPDILIPSFKEHYPRKAYVDESVSREIVRLMLNRAYN